MQKHSIRACISLVRHNAPTTIMLHILSRFDVSLKLKMEALFSWVAGWYRLELKCVPLEDLFRTNTGEKSTQVRSPSLRISRKKGSFFKTSACPRFCKRRVLFLTQVRRMGWKSPYNPRNMRGCDAEWLPKWLGFRVCCRHLLPLNTQRIIKSKVKIRVPVHLMSVFW